MQAGWTRGRAAERAWRCLLVACWLALAAGCARQASPPAPAQANPTEQAGTTTDAAPRIAVLPFAVDGASDDAYLGDGLAEQLAATLSRVPGIVVLSPESTFRFRDTGELNSVIAGQLSATHVLRGSVAREGEALKVGVRLLRGDDGQAAFARDVQRLPGKLFEMQDDIAAALTEALGRRLPDTDAQDERPPGGSVQAYEALLKGNLAARGNDIFSARQAVDAYALAASLDPAWAHARARLALARIQQAQRFPLDAAQARAEGDLARREAAAALRMAPGSAEAHRAQAAWLGSVALDQAGALQETREALALRPNDASLLHALGMQQTALGQLREAASSLRQALDLNPLAAPMLYNLGSVYLGLADYAQAEHMLRRALALEPSLPLVRAFLAMAVFQQGRTGEAIAVAEKEPAALWRRYALSMAAWADGDRARAEGELQALIREQGEEAATQIAGIYAQRDDREAMFHWLGVARDSGDPGIVEIRYMPFVSRYADDPRFIALARELDLLPEPGAPE